MLGIMQMRMGDLDPHLAAGVLRASESLFQATLMGDFAAMPGYSLLFRYLGLRADRNWKCPNILFYNSISAGRIKRIMLGIYQFTGNSGGCHPCFVDFEVNRRREWRG